jgi:hypothetical protein
MSMVQAELWLVEQVAENATAEFACALAHEEMFTVKQLRELERAAEVAVVEALAFGVPQDLLERMELTRDAGESGVWCAEGLCPYC